MNQQTKVEALGLFDIVLSIYNQEKIIVDILKGILSNTTTPFNLILVFDGCTDNTRDLALSYLKNGKFPLLKDLRVTTAANVYETKANNVGFKLATEKYLITIQDDMLVEEKGWEIRLTYPLRKYTDTFSVTARTAFNIYFKDGSDNPTYIDTAAREYLSLKRNQFAIRSGINRGPVAFRTEALKKVGYLDEIFAPAQWDEFDLVLRAYDQLGLKSGAFHIDYRSDAAWGKTRQSETTMNTNSTYKRNVLLLKNRYPKLKSPEGSIVENRYIPLSDIDYVECEAFIPRSIKRIRSDIRNTNFFLRRKYIFAKHHIKSYCLRLLGRAR